MYSQFMKLDQETLSDELLVRKMSRID